MIIPVRNTSRGIVLENKFRFTMSFAVWLYRRLDEM